MRLFIACLATETNTFAPFPTGMAAFRQGSLELGADSPLFAPLSVFRERGTQDGHEIVESIGTVAMPSGKTVRSVYEELRGTLLKELVDSGPIDVVLLMLHGAMIADGYEDCEGDLLARVRDHLPDAVIGAVLDPHCHMTPEMVEAADLLIPAQEYPHTDFALQGEKLYRLCLQMARGKARPSAALFDLRMIGLYPTVQSAMRQFYREVREFEGRPGVLSASFIHGFPWGDVENMGSRILVYSDHSVDQARQAAIDIGQSFYPLRMVLRQSYPSISEALDRAVAADGQVILADFADNAHGGAPSDSTFFLEQLIARDCKKVALGAIWDPVVADLCADAGIGAALDVRLGGKCGPSSGSPVDLDVRVMNIEADHVQTALGDRQSMGLSVWLKHKDIDIVVCSVRTQVFSPDAFTGLGIDLAGRKLVIVKSMVHFRAAFEPIADHVWTVGTPGALQPTLEAIDYKNRSRPYFPKDENPWELQPPECWTAVNGWQAVLFN